MELIILVYINNIYYCLVNYKSNISKGIPVELLKDVVKVLIFAVILAGYHVYYVQPGFKQAESERYYYLLDVDALMTFKAAQLVAEYKGGKVDLSKPEIFNKLLDDFKSQLQGSLRDLVGGAPVFFPRAVYSSDDMVDLTPLVASKLGIDLSADFIRNILPPKESEASAPSSWQQELQTTPPATQQ
jgi:hypothetical protein